MNDIAATLAGAGIDLFDKPANRRKEIGEKYREQLSQCNKTKLLTYYPDREPNYQIFPVHVVDRDAFAEHMKRQGIVAKINNRRNDIYPMFGGRRDDLTQNDKCDQDVVLLPIHNDLTDEQVEHIIEVVQEYDKA